MWQILLIILAVLYLLNPYDLIPDLLVGWGWLDDIVILGFLLRYLHKLRKKRSGFQDRAGSRENSANDRFRAYDRDDDPSVPRGDPYQILGIAADASAETIKQAYRELAGKYHPDKVEYLGDEFRALAEKRFKEIQWAYEKLKRG